MLDQSKVKILKSRFPITLETPEVEANGGLNEFVEAYQNSLDSFSTYLESLKNSEKESFLKEYKINIEYYINEIELRFLLILQYIASYCPELINEPSGYSFVACEAFFLKSCKDIFCIESDDDFTSNFVDKLFPIIKRILEKVDEENAKRLFSRTLSSLQLTFFYRESKDSIISLLEKINNKVDSVKLYIAVSSEVHQIRDLLLPFTRTKNAFNDAIQNLVTSVEHRFNKRFYLKTLIERRAEQTLASLHNFTDEIFPLMKEPLEFAVKEFAKILKEDKDFSPDEKKLFLEERLNLEAEVSVRTHIMHSGADGLFLLPNLRGGNEESSLYLAYH